VASALVNTAQQIGGSLGTALLNTIAASALTSYLADHAKSGPQAQVMAVGTVHSYTVAFWVSAGLIALAALIAAVLVRARRDQLSVTEGVPAAF
jgi:2-keto-3-deoxy-6-phosphogluconate aldolase